MAEGSKQIVPWSCHICGRVFNIPYHGGVYSICLEPTCRGHLRRTYDKDPSTDKRRLSFVCTSCRKTRTDQEVDQRPWT